MSVCANGDGNRAYRSHGICRACWDDANSGRRCADCGKAIRYENRSGVCIRCQRLRKGSAFLPAAAYVDRYLRSRAALAKVNQALLILQHPETAFPATVEECLAAAVEELET